MTIPTQEALLQMPPGQAIGLLLGVITDLQRQLAEKSPPPKDSSNSSKPSSTDFVPRTRTLRGRSGKKSGGQPGHQEHTRTRTDTPDLIQTLRPSSCSSCGSALAESLPGSISQRRQIIDLPPTRALTTEYQALAVTCPDCQVSTAGAFPASVVASVAFGPRLQAVVVHLKEFQHLSYQRLQETLHDLFDCSISQASLVGLVADAAQTCSQAHASLQQEVITSPVIACDETGLRVCGRGQWLWAFRTPLLTLLVVSASRGADVIASVLGGLETKAAWVSDRWRAQFRDRAAGGHQLCLPHILRELQYCLDLKRSAWAYQVGRGLRKAMALRRRIDLMVEKGQDCWSHPEWVAWRVRAVAAMERQLDEALASPATHGVDRTLKKALCKPAHREALTLFLRRSDVPYDNNGSERDLRPKKVHQKVIGGFRSAAGAERHALVLSIVQTAQKQKKNVLERLTELLGAPQPIHVCYALIPTGAE
jgi:transposase